MSRWSSAKARRVLAAILRIGWSIKRHSGGSHRVLERVGWPDYVFSFHDDDEIGPRMLARIAKRTGLTPGDRKVGCSRIPALQDSLTLILQQALIREMPVASSMEIRYWIDFDCLAGRDMLPS